MNCFASGWATQPECFRALRKWLVLCDYWCIPFPSAKWVVLDFKTQQWPLVIKEEIP